LRLPFARLGRQQRRGAVLTRAVKQALTAYIFALFKAIVGSGILSLANAIARWTDNPALIAPVVALSVAR
jgi:hypothetical protein